MARKTVLVSDMSGAEIAEGKGATVRITFHDARKGVRELDVTDAEAEKMGGRQVARRGRRPKSRRSSATVKVRGATPAAFPVSASASVGGGPDYHGRMVSGPRRRAGESRQDRASARGIPRGDRARSGPDRPEPGGRRPDRARPAAARRRPARAARSARSTTSSASSRSARRMRGRSRAMRSAPSSRGACWRERR